jgi:hypothetical protein
MEGIMKRIGRISESEDGEFTKGSVGGCNSERDEIYVFVAGSLLEGGF